MARTESMAAIDAKIAGDGAAPPDAQKPDAAVFEPHASPGVAAPSPLTSLTPGEKRALDAARQERAYQDTREQDALSEQQRLLSQQEAEQEAEQSAFVRGAQTTFDRAKSIVRGAAIRLESLPTPGSLVLPLAVLVVFFLLLIPVNGHTRFTWLWLAMSGNAQIGSTTAPAPESTSVAAPAPESTSILQAVTSGVTAAFAGNETPA